MAVTASWRCAQGAARCSVAHHLPADASVLRHQVRPAGTAGIPRVCASHGESQHLVRPRPPAVAGQARRLAPLCAHEPAGRALYPRARSMPFHLHVLHLILEFSGPPIRRTPTVASAAKRFSSDWGGGLGQLQGARCRRPGTQWREPAAAMRPPWSKYGGSVCTSSPFAAERRLSAPSLCPTHLSALCRPMLCTPFLCAPVSSQVVTEVIGPAQKPVAEAMATSGAWVGEALACTAACGCSEVASWRFATCVGLYAAIFCVQVMW